MGTIHFPREKETPSKEGALATQRGREVGGTRSDRVEQARQPGQNFKFGAQRQLQEGHT